MVKRSGLTMPIKNLNPMQYIFFNAVPMLTSGCNAVIVSGTGTGKTLIGYAAISRVLNSDPNAKAVYVSPSKALVKEKGKELDEWFPQFDNFMLYGDTGILDERLQQRINSARIVVCTYEMLASRLTKQHAEKSKWLDDVECVIWDEYHGIGSEGRGATFEMAMMFFISYNPDAMNIVLSATLGNPYDLKTFIERQYTYSMDCNSCYNRTCPSSKVNRILDVDMLDPDYDECTSWEPRHKTYVFVNELREEYGGRDPSACERRIYSIDIPSGSYQQRMDDKLEAALSLCEMHSDRKVIVFCGSIAKTYNVAEYLRMHLYLDPHIDPDEYVRVHNSKVSAYERHEIESEFDKHDGPIGIVVATSTLALGVDMPADVGVIYDTKRGPDEIDAADIHQEMGRCGRPKSLWGRGAAYILFDLTEEEQ